MRIKQLDIYGYGKWVNQSFSVDSQLQLFYGPNESGKSTLQSFIRSILFGFPTRHRRKHQINRYVPRHSDVYGGRILVEDPQYGILWIERSTNQLTLTRTNGDAITEFSLSDMLGGLTEELYDSFYAFSLQNLQQIRELGSDRLNEYFLSIGTAGSDQFLQLANQLDKEADQLYLAKGKKPLLNQQLQEYEATSQQAEVLAGNMDRYDDLIIQQTTSLATIDQLKEALEQVEIELRNQSLLIERYDIYRKLQQHEATLASLEYTEMAADAPDRLREAEMMMASIEKEENQNQDRLRRLKGELASLTQLTWARNQAGSRKEWREDLDQIKEVQTRIESVNRQIGEIDDNLQVIADQGKFLPEKVSAEEDYQVQMEEGLVIQASLQDQTKEVEQLETQRSVYLEQRREQQSRSTSTRQQIASLENRRVNEEEVLYQQTSLREYLVGFVAIILGALLLIFNYIMHANTNALLLWSGLAMLLTGIGISLYIFFRHRRLLAEFNNSPILARLADLYEQDEDYREQSQELSLVINGLEEQIDEAKTRLEAIQHDQQVWLVSIGFHPTADAQWVLSANPVKQYFDRIKEKEKLEAELEELSSKVYAWRESIQLLLERFPYKNIQTRELIRHVEDVEAGLIESERQGEILEERIKEAENRQVANQEKINQYQALIDEILQATASESVAAFQAKLETNQQIQTLEHEKQVYLDQIAPYLDQLSQIDHKQSLEESYQATKTRQQELNQQLLPLINERADLTHQINQLQQDGSYQEINQCLANQEADIRASLVEWGRRKLANRMIIDMLRQGVENPLPEMNQVANELFETLSYGRYQAIKINKNGIKVKQFSNTYFEPHELSQGTLEQLYVALRLAFIITAQDMVKMPIIVDDAFVNFDEYRKNSMYQVLDKISQEIQVLFFTFDQQASEFWDKDQTIYLKVNQ